MKKIVIDNKREHIVCLPNAVRRITIRLVPGPNKVPHMAWEAVKDYPSVMARIDDGWLEIIGTVDEKVDVKSFLDLNAARARKEAREMAFDEGTIKAWLEVETRASVARELKVRLEAEHVS